MNEHTVDRPPRGFPVDSLASLDCYAETLPAAARMLSDSIKAFTCEKRLSILSVLARGDHNVTQICGALSLSQPAVSQQLGVLKDHGLVIGERRGKAVHYRLNRERIDEFYEALGETIGCEKDTRPAA